MSDTISMRQLAYALESLGLEPTEVRSVRIDSGLVIAEVYVRRESTGKWVILDNEVVTETRVLVVDED